jgi:DnaK suppressor protein
MAAETKRRRLRQVQMIDTALQRLEDGEYGFCVVCGEEIESGRLALDPAVPTCVTHAV